MVERFKGFVEVRGIGEPGRQLGFADPRALGLGGTGEPDCEEVEARRLMLESALTYIKEARDLDQPEFGEMYEDFAEHHQERLTALLNHSDSNADMTQYTRQKAVALDLLRVQRKTVVDLRDAGRISDTVLRRLERELDLSETKMSAV